MRLPRDLSGRQLAQLPRVVGYETTRQSGSHLHLTTQRNGEHHLKIPDHSTLRIGMLSAIVGEAAEHLGMTRDELLKRLLQ